MQMEQALRDRISTLEDELARCTAERNLALQAEEQFHRFSDGVKDYARITVDTDNRIVGWNKGAEHILGYTEPEILGQPVDILLTPEDRAAGASASELITALQDSFAEIERWQVDKEGSRFWASGVITPVFNHDGRLRGYSMAFRNQTARKMEQERLRQSEERFRLLSENVIDYALILLDREGRVSGWNAGGERIFGYSEAEIVGQQSVRFFPIDDIEGGAADWDLAEAANNGRSESERWMVRRDNSRFWARWVTTPMRDEHGNLLGFAKVLRDETERKQAEEKKAAFEAREREFLRNEVRSAGEKLDRSKEELRALTASLIKAQEEERRRIGRELHDDLSQQLAILGIGLARLSSDLININIETVRAELSRLENLAASISEDLRRLSHQLHPSIIYHLGLPAALRSLVEEFQRSRSGSVHFKAGELLDELPSDVAAAMYRITQEALRNVAKHAPAASVGVLLVPDSDGLRLTIEDEGPGFDPDAVRGQGGLGIISMQERTQILGGNFLVRSAPGQGTRIEVRVPVKR